MSRILEPIKIDVDTEVFFNVKWEDYRSSCIQHQKTEQKDLHPDNKMPDSLVLDNTAIHQKFFDRNLQNSARISSEFIHSAFWNSSEIQKFDEISTFSTLFSEFPRKFHQNL